MSQVTTMDSHWPGWKGPVEIQFIHRKPTRREGHSSFRKEITLVGHFSAKLRFLCPPSRHFALPAPSTARMTWQSLKAILSPLLLQIQHRIPGSIWKELCFFRATHLWRPIDRCPVFFFCSCDKNVSWQFFAAFLLGQENCLEKLTLLLIFLLSAQQPTMPLWSLKFNRKSKTNEVASLLKVIISQCNIFRTFKLKHWSGKREEKAKLAVCNSSSDVLITQKHAISSPPPSSYGHSIYALKIPTVLIFRRPLEIALFISQTGKWSDSQAGLINVKQQVCSSALNCTRLRFAFISLPVLALFKFIWGKKLDERKGKPHHYERRKSPHTRGYEALVNLLESLQQGFSCTL